MGFLVHLKDKDSPVRIDADLYRTRFPGHTFMLCRLA